MYNRPVRSCVVLASVLGACGYPALPALTDAPTGDDAPIDAPAIVRAEVARVPVTRNRDIDLLFVIDDSSGMVANQTSLKNAWLRFENEITALDGSLPNVHIGVVSTDLGTKGAGDASAGPPIGNGPGSCSGTGKSGNLQTNGTSLITGTFIADTKNTDGTRNKNYTGTLDGAFGAIASVGESGCGFEQPIQAAKSALANNSANVGFLRVNAGLAIIVLTDEDDCSMAHSTLLGTDTATLGPLTSFRCTRFGVTCDGGGTTTDEMNTVGTKSQCHSNEASAFLTPIGDFATFFAGLKTDPSNVIFAGIMAPTTPFGVEPRTVGTMTSPGLAHSCPGAVFGDPAVRLDEMASKYARHTTQSICSSDFSEQLLDVARQVRGVMGDPCLTQEIAQPADCVVVDKVGTTTTPVPACGPSAPTNCFQLVADAAACSLPSHLRLDVTRSAAPPANLVTIVNCKL